MYELIKILLFGKLILLTPTYITIDANKVFSYKKKLKLLNKEASVQIDISKSYIKNILGLNNIVDYQIEFKLKTLLKKCPIKVYAVKGNQKIFFGYPYLSIVSKEDIRLVFQLKNKKDIKEIDSLYIRPSCTLDNVKIYWKNYGE